MDKASQEIGQHCVIEVERLEFERGRLILDPPLKVLWSEYDGSPSNRFVVGTCIESEPNAPIFYGVGNTEKGVLSSLAQDALWQREAYFLVKEGHPPCDRMDRCKRGKNNACSVQWPDQQEAWKTFYEDRVTDVSIEITKEWTSSLWTCFNKRYLFEPSICPSCRLSRK